MVEKKKTSKYVKPTLVNNSARYKIGGKEYTANDVARMKSDSGGSPATGKSNYAPKYVSSTPGNLSRSVNTSAGTTAPSQNVHAQGEAYKPSTNTQASVKTAVTPQGNTFKPSVSKPVTTPSVEPQKVSTGSDAARYAESRVQAQTQNYYSNNVTEAVRTPQSVAAIKTTAAPETKTGKGTIPRPQQGVVGQNIKTPTAAPHTTPTPTTSPAAPSPGTGSNIKTAAPKMGTSPVKAALGVTTPVPGVPGSAAPIPGTPSVGMSTLRTDSQIKNAVQNSVQTQTDYFHSTNAFGTEKTNIRSAIDRTPRTVSAIQTAAPMTGKQQFTASPQTAALGQGGVKTSQPNQHPTGSPVGTSVKAAAPKVESSPVSPVKTTPGIAPSAPGIPGTTAPTAGVPAMGTPTLRTDSQIKSAVQNSVQTQTEYFHSTNAFGTEKTNIRSAIERTPRTVSAIQTAAPMTGKQTQGANTHAAQQGAAGIKTAAKVAGQPSGVSPTVAGAVATGKAPGIPGAAGGRPKVEVGPISHITVQGAGNIRTTAQMANLVEQKVRSQTEFFHSNNAVVAGIRGISNEGRVMPRNVAGIQTGTPIGRTGTGTAYRPNVPSVGAGNVGSVTLTKGQLHDMKANMRHLGISDKVTTGNIRSTHATDRAFRMSSQYLNGKIHTEIKDGKNLMGKFAGRQETAKEFFRAVGAVGSYNISSEAARALQKHKEASGKKDLLSGGRLVLGYAEGQLLQSDDLGDQSAGTAIAAGLVAYSAGKVAFKGAQWATSEAGIESMKKVGNGAYQVVTTAGRTGIVVGTTVKTMISKQVAPFSKETINILRRNAQLSGLNDTKIVRGIVNRVEGVKTGFHRVVSTAQEGWHKATVGYNRVKTAVDTSVRIVHGVATGKLTVTMTKAQVEMLRQRMIRGIQTGTVRGLKTATAYTVRGLSKGAGVAVFRGLPTAGRLAKGGIMTAAGTMMRSEDYTIQGVGTAITAVDIGIRTSAAAAKGVTAGVKTGVKATKYTVKTAVKAGKGAVTGYKLIKNHGLQVAWQRARIKAMQESFKLGRTVVSVLIQAGKLAVSKIALPILLICLVVLLLFVGLSGASGAASAIFSGVFEESDTDKEYFYRDYLLDKDGEGKGLPPLVNTFKGQLAGALQSKLGSYDIVRFYSDMNQEDVLYSHFNDTTIGGSPSAAVSAGMPSTEMLANIVQPLLSSIILIEEDMEPTDARMRALVKEIFESLYDINDPKSVDKDETVEHCGQALKDGEGQANEPCDECGEIHALEDCPNARTGYHSYFVCSECDEYYWLCNGHRGSRVCGRYEHAHDMSCWTALCGKNHEHFWSCYTVCGLDEYWWHEHDVNCIYFGCGMYEHIHQGWYSEYNPGCYSTSYHLGELSSPCSNSTRYFRCNGYRYCDSHSVYTYVLHMQGLTKLVKKYFTDPIAQLEAIGSRTEEQEKKLQGLKDAHEIMQIMIDEYDALFPEGGGVAGGGGAGGGGAGAGGGDYGASPDVFYGGSGLMTPVNFTRLTSPFGWRIHPTQGDERFHSGVDLAAPQGTPIYAAMDGTVVQAYFDPKIEDGGYGGGNSVIIKHDNGYQTGYAHMVQYIVSAGQQVKQGECIGYVGSTGNSTGPHLHLTVRLNGERVNPEQHIDLNWKPGNDGFAS